MPLDEEILFSFGCVFNLFVNSSRLNFPGVGQIVSSNFSYCSSHTTWTPYVSTGQDREQIDSILNMVCGIGCYGRRYRTCTRLVASLCDNKQQWKHNTIHNWKTFIHRTTDNLPTSFSGQIMILPKLAMFGQGRALEFAYSHPGEDRHDRLWKWQQTSLNRSTFLKAHTPSRWFRGTYMRLLNQFDDSLGPVDSMGNPIKVRWLGQAGQTSTRQPPLGLFPRGIMDWAPGINKNTAGTLPAVLFFESDSHEQQMDTVWLPVAIRKEHPPSICVFRWSSLHINTRTCIQWWTIPRTLLGSQHESSLGLIQKSDPYLDQLRRSNKHHQISIPSGNQRRCGFPNHGGTETFSPSFQSQRRV